MPNPYFSLDNLQHVADRINMDFGWSVTRLKMNHATRRYLIILMNREITMHPGGQIGFGEVVVEAVRDMPHGEIEFVDDRHYRDLDEAPRTYKCFPAAVRDGKLTL